MLLVRALIIGTVCLLGVHPDSLAPTTPTPIWNNTPDLVNPPGSIDVVALPSASPSLADLFAMACEGEVWVIDADETPVMKEPKWSLNQQEYEQNLLTKMDGSTRVEILRGFRDALDKWKGVRLSDGPEGWVYSAWVQSAHRVKQGPKCP